MHAKPIILAIATLAGAFLLPATAPAAKPKPPNPADYPLTMHVLCSDGFGGQRIGGLLDGKPVELVLYYDPLHGEPGNVPLKLGDYKMRSLGTHPVRLNSPYDANELYEMLFDNLTLRGFTLYAVGTTGCSDPAR